MTKDIQKALESAQSQEEARKLITEYKLTDDDLKTVTGGEDNSIFTAWECPVCGRRNYGFLCMFCGHLYI